MKTADLTSMKFFALKYPLIEFYLYSMIFLLAVFGRFLSYDVANSPEHVSNNLQILLSGIHLSGRAPFDVTTLQRQMITSDNSCH